MSEVRLFVDCDIASCKEIALGKEQSHYLSNVMRLGIGKEIRLFNGREGEFATRITASTRKSTTVEILGKTADLAVPPDLWLLFAPIKKARTDFIVEKAAELGVRRIQPVFTRFTNSERLRVDRLQAHAVEAAEQCGGTFVPQVAEPLQLASLLSDWEPERRLVFCDEERSAAPMAEAIGNAPAPAAILIGPEGGFAPEETAHLRSLPFVVPAALGPRILRADTAAVAAIAIWQAGQGDWQ